MKYIIILCAIFDLGACGPRSPFVYSEQDCSTLPPQSFSDYVNKCSLDVLTKREVNAHYAVAKCEDLARLTLCTKRHYTLDDNDNKIYQP